MFPFMSRTCFSLKLFSSTLRIFKLNSQTFCLLKRLRVTGNINYYRCNRSSSTGDLEIIDDNIDLTEKQLLENWLQNTLNIDITDNVISQSLASCTSIQQLFTLLKTHRDQLTASNTAHSVLVLGFLQGLYTRIQFDHGLRMNSITVEQDFIDQLHKYEDFNDLLDLVRRFTNALSIDELTGCLLYLSKMNVDLKSDVMQNIITRLVNEFDNNIPDDVSLRSLSRFAVALQNSVYELWTTFMLLKLVPLVNQKIDSVKTSEDFHLLSVCLLHIHQVLDPIFVEKYWSLCDKLITESVLNPSNCIKAHSITKAIAFFCLPHWSIFNSSKVRKLISLLRGHVRLLERRDLITLQKAYQVQLEPATIVDELYETSLALFHKVNEEHMKITDFGLLSTVAQLSPQSKRQQIEEILINELPTTDFLENQNFIFQILRSIKSSNVKLCNQFWSRSIQLLKTFEEEREPYKLLRIASKYMYFNNNLAGTYRHHEFESSLIVFLLKEMKTGRASYTPDKFARSAAFILAYSTDSAILIYVINNLVKFSKQLTMSDCMIIARGIEIMFELTKKNRIDDEVVEKLVALDGCLNECALRHINQDKSNQLVSLITLLKTYCSRRASLDFPFFNQLIKKLEKADGEMNSRLARDISYCFLNLNYLSPSLLNKISAYIINNHESVGADTAERVLSACYHLNYLPKNGDKFLQTCSQLIARDRERLTGLSIIQACLALSFFHEFPSDLIGDIFSVAFLDRIDEEINICYSRAIYPLKVRQTLMELNRSVCIDSPELDVPWFHEKYIQEVTALNPPIQSTLERNISENLTKLLKSPRYFQTHVYSPYGYKINFLIHLDRRNNPLEKNANANIVCKKIAILVHSSPHFTKGMKHLRGVYQMRKRHLEMLGYVVVPIDEHVWHAMYMSEAHEKLAFLSKHIWPER